MALTYSFPHLEPVCCSMSSSNCWFLTCIPISQEGGKVVWHSHLFKNFPQFVAIHTVKGFSVVNEAEVDAFLEFSSGKQDCHDCPRRKSKILNVAPIYHTTDQCWWRHFTSESFLSCPPEGATWFLSSPPSSVLQLRQMADSLPSEASGKPSNSPRCSPCSVLDLTAYSSFCQKVPSTPTLPSSCPVNSSLSSPFHLQHRFLKKVANSCHSPPQHPASAFPTHSSHQEPAQCLLFLLGCRRQQSRDHTCLVSYCRLPF